LHIGFTQEKLKAVADKHQLHRNKYKMTKQDKDDIIEGIIVSGTIFLLFGLLIKNLPITPST